MAGALEVDEAPVVADLTRLPDREARCARAVQVGVEGLGPVGDVLQALVPCREEVPVHAGSVVSLLDQLDLQWPRIREGDAHFQGGGFAPVVEALDRHAFEVPEGSDTHDLGPMGERCIDVANDVAVLAHGSEQAAHAATVTRNSSGPEAGLKAARRGHGSC